MGLENNRWHVYAGDTLWKIASAVYSNPYRWREIADANGIAQSSGLIYPHQLLALPGITPGYGGGGNPYASPPAPEPTRPRIDWFKLQAGSDRTMEAIWTYDGTTHYWYRWEQWDAAGHLWMLDENRNYDGSVNRASVYTLNSTEGWNVCRFSVRPVDQDGNILPNTDWGYLEYDFRNNPPLLPPDPDVSIDENNKLTVTMENIDEHINGTDIEIAVYQDDNVKYVSPIIPINFTTLSLSFTYNVDPGHTYRVRCRAVRILNDYSTINGGWTNFSSPEKSVPVAPEGITNLESKVIVEQSKRTYGIYIEWTPVDTADGYTIEYTTDPTYFDSGTGTKTIDVDKNNGEHLLITDLDLGNTYFFRICSTNEKGKSKWTDIVSTSIGTKPSAPTTWSTISSVIIGNNVNLYWTHNSTDGSVETVARLHMEAIDTTDPSSVPMVIEKVIHHQVVENESENRTSYYTINSTDPEWTFLQQGFKIKWKVQTAGVTSEYSDYSTEREINFYAQPSVTLDLKNNTDESIDEISSFPFYLSVLATPPAQTPISYYIEVIANDGYVALDDVGNQKVINPGDTIYTKTYDPNTTNPWRFLLEFTPGNIDLQSGIEYNIRCTVSMDSGLNGYSDKTFSVFFDEKYYDVRANINLNKETYEATINPLCYEFSNIEGEIIEELVTDCLMSVYRINYDGSFTEIAKDVNNQEGLYITDPHPTLDYARYRIVAKESETGAMSYADIEPVKFGEFAIIIQWAEKWINFDEGEDSAVEKPWSGSLLRLPYNIKINDNNSKDATLIEYIGRSHPVSYYGTQLGTSSTWSTDIPKSDKETLYAIRRLSKWTGDVYVREPSGIGYWANINVNYNIDYDSLIIPISMTITRVEGGI